MVALDWRLAGVVRHELTDVPGSHERLGAVHAGGLQEFDDAVLPENCRV